MPRVFVVEYNIFLKGVFFMRKIIAMLLVMAAVVTCLVSCGKSDAVKAVDEKIAAIGEITLEKENLIIEAEEAFALLTDEDKKDADEKELKTAREDFDALKAFSGKADSAVRLYKKALTEYGTAKATITETYDALSQELASCKKELKAEYEKIFEAVKAKNDEYENIAAEAVASAKAYVDYFKSINADKTVTIKEIGCIAQIDDGTTYYLFAITYNDGTADINAYSRVRFAGTPAKETFDNYADNFYCDAPSSEKSDALLMGNIEIAADSVN